MPITFILFVFGLAFGSFFNVIADRYDGERVVASPKVIGGRSHCPHCRRTLRAIELIPVISFLALGGKCRSCHARIGWQYPIVELLTGCIFAFVPWRIDQMFGGAPSIAVIGSVIWVLVFSALLIMSIIDLRLGIIPDEINVFLAILGLAAGVAMAQVSQAHISWFGPFLNFGISTPGWLNIIVGALVGGGLFGGLWLGTRGRGMGFGDVKLAFPLGLIFGWPDILGLSMFAFIAGAIVGVGAILFGKKNMKSAIPFGPFLAFAAAIVFFFGSAMLRAYLNILGV